MNLAKEFLVRKLAKELRIKLNTEFDNSTSQVQEILINDLSVNSNKCFSECPEEVQGHFIDIAEDLYDWLTEDLDKGCENN
jgi:hypothetical protein